MHGLVQSAPPGIYLFLGLVFVGMIAWAFALGYVLNRGRKRILGILLTFLPAIIVVGSFLMEAVFSPQLIFSESSYILSTIRYHLTFYILPPAIGYVAGFLIASSRK